MSNPTHDEHSLRDALEQLCALIVELQSDAQLEIEVTHDSTTWLEVAFTGKTGEGVKMSALIGPMNGVIMRRAWSERSPPESSQHGPWLAPGRTD